MLQTTLLVLIALGVVALGLIHRSHQKWVRREFHKNTMAHGRIVKALPVTAPIPLVRPADWSDDRALTRKMQQNDYPPVDFRYSGW